MRINSSGVARDESTRATNHVGRLLRRPRAPIVRALSRRLHWNGGAYRAVNVLGALSKRQPKRVAQKTVTTCSSVWEWGITHPGTEATLISPAQILYADLPHTIEPEILPVFYERLQIPRPTKYLARPSSAKLVGDSGIVILPDATYSIESAYTPAMLKEELDAEIMLVVAWLHREGSRTSRKLRTVYANLVSRLG